MMISGKSADASATLFLVLKSASGISCSSRWILNFCSMSCTTLLSSAVGCAAELDRMKVTVIGS